MKNNLIVLAATSGVIAAAALLLSYVSFIDADSFVGYASILVLLGLAAMEYRINWKRILRR